MLYPNRSRPRIVDTPVQFSTWGELGSVWTGGGEQPPFDEGGGKNCALVVWHSHDTPDVTTDTRRPDSCPTSGPQNTRRLQVRGVVHIPSSLSLGLHSPGVGGWGGSCVRWTDPVPRHTKDTIKDSIKHYAIRYGKTFRLLTVKNLDPPTGL